MYFDKTMAGDSHTALKAALQWHLDHGADEALLDEPVDHTALRRPAMEPEAAMAKAVMPATAVAEGPNLLAGTGEIAAQAAALAAGCATLDELKQAIADFDGLAVKKTATQMVFADGDAASSRIMLIGEAPGADEDRMGLPFVGVSGQLLDKILASINLARRPEEGQQGVYISNILNWRPPGNRTPSDQEIQIALPFIQKHIELAAPDFIILCGGVAAKGLLHSAESITKLRGRFHDMPVGGRVIPAMATYHPSYLLRTPSQKRAVWQDMLMLQDRLA